MNLPPQMAPVPGVPFEETEERAPHGALWLVLLFFRPRTFFRHFVVDSTPVLTALCAWAYGATGVIDRLDNAVMKGSTFLAGSWGSYWGTVLLGGIVGGFLYFAIGGWWYRVRLGWSGAVDPDPALARRVYLFASQTVALPALAVALLDTGAHGTPTEACLSEGRWWHVAFLLFPFWSLWTSYAGARTAFELRRGAALGWFVIAPGVLYAIIFGGIVALAWNGLLAAAPNVKQTQRFDTPIISFEYPGNWAVDTSDEDYDPAAYIPISPPQDATCELYLYARHRSPAEEVAGSLESFASVLDGMAESGTFTSVGRFPGEGRIVRGNLSGSAYVLRVFVTEAGPGLMLELRELFRADDEEKLGPGLELIRSTLRVDGDGWTRPDVAHPREHNEGGVRFSLPGNWVCENDEWSKDDPGYYVLVVSPDERSHVEIQCYESEQTPAEEVEATCARMAEALEPWEVTGARRKYGEYDVVGKVGRGVQNGTPFVVRVHVASLGEKMRLEVVERCPEDAVELLRPAFELVASTLRVE